MNDDVRSVALTRDFRLLQRARGHRFSVDDMLVAHLACRSAATPRRVLDLGCGVGSVLLMVGWARPAAELVGVEAQPASAELARRNVALNHCEARGRIVEGDLRDEATLSGLGRFDLVTATPPYFDPEASTPSPEPQRAFARWEMRGGIEDYARAAARTLAPGGLLCACAASDPPGRTRRALAAAGLSVRTIRSVVPRAGRPPFLELVVATDAAGEVSVEEPLVLRDAEGALTAEHLAIRDWFGFTRTRADP